MRKFRSKNEWLTVFDEHKTSGLSIIDYCQQNAISTTAFYSARTKFVGKTQRQKPSFIKATVTTKTEQIVLSQQAPIRVKTPYAEVELPVNCHSQLIVDILKGLQA
ncbi:hypothetical protein SG34_033140 [Thalassomonas viridans]|uniref:Transposase n=1 Tax=Thalassomonas viridans TaxID=137584 RepID=A0AAE9Z919_9GAMM|nr:hypothetical protein [Thalassomonas viridans]WDE06674.1 hypothetical protein SG34_007150 [Thalassomonas viridans]WDE08748.1 hypothetical protein SG34_033140 [Thalassomonas viridans]